MGKTNKFFKIQRHEQHRSKLQCITSNTTWKQSAPRGGEFNPKRFDELCRLTRTKIAACFLFCFAPLALGQVVWSPIASNQNFDVGIDYDSLKRSSGIAKFRIKTTDKADRSIMYEDLELDCQLKRVRSIWAKKYDWRNKVRGTSTTPGSWDGVQPNTIMSVIYAQACMQ